MAEGKHENVDQELIDTLLNSPESYHFECKRMAGKIDKLLETVVAFANSDGGVLALGLEDPDKAEGTDRLLGLEENPENWDELLRKITSRITESEQLQFSTHRIKCRLRSGTEGTLGLLKVAKSARVHSIVDNGTYVRLGKGNQEITAAAINQLSFARGTISAETQLVEVDLELLNTEYWRAYSMQRGLTREFKDALYTLGLAKKNAQGELRPTMAAVLLFAEEPSSVLAAKTAVRIYHYQGPRPSTEPNTNLAKPPITISGPILKLIREAYTAVVRELGERMQHTELGFEIVQKYPLRVVNEAITNAVLHRDYRLPADIAIRIFSDRIEVESPGLLVGPVTPENIGRVGTHPRNKLLVQHLREFPSAPNLDAGEGVPMMFGTMRMVGLYPPQFVTRPRIEREAVVTTLLNQNRPSAWEQVEAYLERHPTIGNAEVRKMLNTEDTLTASKQLKSWVEQGLLSVSNPTAGRGVRRYTLSRNQPSLFSTLDGKRLEENS